jgi:hypothetical protein
MAVMIGEANDADLYCSLDRLDHRDGLAGHPVRVDPVRRL